MTPYRFPLYNSVHAWEKIPSYLVSWLVSWSGAEIGFYFVDPQGPKGIICDPALDIYWGFSGCQTGSDCTYQSDHDDLEFAWHSPLLRYLIG